MMITQTSRRAWCSRQPAVFIHSDTDVKAGDDDPSDPAGSEDGDCEGDDDGGLVVKLPEEVFIARRVCDWADTTRTADEDGAGDGDGAGDELPANSDENWFEYCHGNVEDILAGRERRKFSILYRVIKIKPENETKNGRIFKPTRRMCSQWEWKSIKVKDKIYWNFHFPK